MNKILPQVKKYNLKCLKRVLISILNSLIVVTFFQVKAQIYIEQSPVFTSQIPENIIPLDTVYCSDVMNMKQYIDFPFQDNTIYEITSPLTVSWIIPSDFGSLIYASDISGGIIILDPKSPFVPPFLNVGDNIINITGFIVPLNGTLALIPTNKIDIESNDNPVYPQSIDLSIMMLNPTIYESSYVNIGNVDIASNGLSFKPNHKYPIYQNKFSSSINTIFPNANYLNIPIPEGQIIISGIVNFNRFTGEVSITPRSWSDFYFDKGGNYKENWNPDDFFFGDGYLHINSLKRQDIQIFNIMGEKIISKSIEAGISQMKINKTGVYIVKLGTKTGKISVTGRC